MALFLQALVVLPAWGQAELVCTPKMGAQNTSADPIFPADCRPYTSQSFPSSLYLDSVKPFRMNACGLGLRTAVP